MAKKKNKVNRFIFDNEVYKAGFAVQAGGSLESALKWSEKKGLSFDWDSMKYDIENPPSGIVISDKTGIKRFLVWFKDDTPGAGLVSHECLHASVNTLNGAGVLNVPIGEQETVAYLLDWMVIEMGNKLWKK